MILYISFYIISTMFPYSDFVVVPYNILYRLQAAICVLFIIHFFLMWEDVMLLYQQVILHLVI